MVNQIEVNTLDGEPRDMYILNNESVINIQVEVLEAIWDGRACQFFYSELSQEMLKSTCIIENRASGTGSADPAAVIPILSAYYRDGGTRPAETAPARPIICAHYNIVNQVLYVLHALPTYAIETC